AHRRSLAPCAALAAAPRSVIDTPAPRPCLRTLRRGPRSVSVRRPLRFAAIGGFRCAILKPSQRRLDWRPLLPLREKVAVERPDEGRPPAGGLRESVDRVSVHGVHSPPALRAAGAPQPSRSARHLLPQGEKGETTATAQAFHALGCAPANGSSIHPPMRRGLVKL